MGDNEDLFEGYERDAPGWLKTRVELDQEEHCEPLPDFDPYEYDTEYMNKDEMEQYETEADAYEAAGHMKRQDGVAHAQHKATQMDNTWGPRKKALQGRKSTATGPKGVLTDYEEHKLQMRAKELSKGFQKLRTFKELALGKKHYGAVVQKQEVQRGRRPKTSDTEDEDSSDDISDEELLLAYKTEKLLIANADRPTFGRMRELTYLNFDQEIDGEDPGVYILILFFQDYIPECSLLESILRNLAPFYPYLKFMRARTDKILPSLEDHSLPALLVYKDKKQVWLEVTVTRFLPPVFNDDDVVRLLTEANILQHGTEWKAPTKQEFSAAYRNARSDATPNDAKTEDPEEDSYDSFDD